MNFGYKIKELRIERGLTQKCLAKALDVSKSSIGMYEINRAEPSPDMLLKIAKYFDITLDELFGREII